VALSTALILVWSYYVWLPGVAAEVYSPQLAALAALGWTLVKMLQQPKRRERLALVAGTLFGLAVALNPSSVFFAPGVAVAFRLMGVSWRQSIIAAALGVLLLLASLLYFPLRYASQPAFNVAGEYDANGVFQPVNLATVQGIWWILSGAQFEGFMFAEGYVPSLRQLGGTFNYLWSNTLGVGFIVGLVGMWRLYRQRRGVFIGWLVLFLPYTYFYTTYGAVDRSTMFGPSHLLWAALIAFGLRWFTEQMSAQTRILLLMALPLALLVYNWNAVTASDNTKTRERAETVITNLPENTIVFGNWVDIIALQYLQIVEGERPDITLYNLFYFSSESFSGYINQKAREGQRPIIFLRERMDTDTKTAFINAFYQLVPLKAPAGEIVGYQLALPGASLAPSPPVVDAP
jgi:hypothetical protein